MDIFLFSFQLQGFGSGALREFQACASRAKYLTVPIFYFFGSQKIFFIYYLQRYQHKANKVSTLSNVIAYQHNKTSPPRTNTTISFTTSPTRPKQTISSNFLFPLTYVNRIFFLRESSNKLQIVNCFHLFHLVHFFYFSFQKQQQQTFLEK